MGKPANVAALVLTEELWLAPCSTREITKRVSEAHHVSHRTVRRYIEKVSTRYATLFEAAGSNANAIRARAESMLIDAFDVAKANNRAGDMITAAQRIAELHGAFKQEFKLDATPLGIAELLGEVMRSKADVDPDR